MHHRPIVAWLPSQSRLTRVPAILRARRDLHSNQLSGSLPSSLGSMTGLQYMCVVVLSVSALARGTTTALRDVCVLSSAAGVRHRPIVAWLPSQSRLTRVPAVLRARRELYSNQLSGSLPSSLGSLPALTRLCVVVLSVSALALGTTNALRDVCVVFCWRA